MRRMKRAGMMGTAGLSCLMVAGLAMAGGTASQSAPASAAQNGGDFAGRCAALANLRDDAIGAVKAARPGPATFEGRSPFVSGPLALPPHCEVQGSFPSHKGTHGQTYAIRYLLRLPQDWNGRFLFQGGGGTNGVIGEAMGWTSMGNTPGLLQGYAVVSQDSGHDNAVNTDPARAGVAVFGTDPVARRDYGHASLPRVATAAKSLIGRFYGTAPKHSYFFGCSKGGQEGMAFAQRYPDMFDGIVAAAPGFSLPRAAIAQTWDVQRFARLWSPANGPITPTSFASLLNDADFALVRDVVGKSCDGLDGVRDGIVNAFAQCTSARILPDLRKRACGPGAGEGAGDCIAPAKIDALARSLGGPRDGAGKPLYVDWPWDLGIGTPGWFFWKLGSATMPSLNILTGGASLPAVFMTPPHEVREDTPSLLAFQTSFRFPQDARAIYATSRQFPRSSWQDIAMRSPNLDRFRAHGGKLIVPHGVSDPVFSINDTVNWRNEVDARYRGHADDVVRVFPVPGMTHCGGGSATDRFDAFAALVAWVEQGRAPASIAATAGPDTPWPGRQRPLCAYPTIAIYDGKGPIDKKESFRCG